MLLWRRLIHGPTLQFMQVSLGPHSWRRRRIALFGRCSGELAQPSTNSDSAGRVRARSL
jgi:hypothetical protein